MNVVDCCEQGGVEERAVYPYRLAITGAEAVAGNVARWYFEPEPRILV